MAYIAKNTTGKDHNLDNIARLHHNKIDNNILGVKFVTDTSGCQSHCQATRCWKAIAASHPEPGGFHVQSLRAAWLPGSHGLPAVPLGESSFPRLKSKLCSVQTGGNDAVFVPRVIINSQ